MKKVTLFTYHYDPLDRLKSTTSALQSGSLRFYCQSRIATEIQGSTQHSIMQHGDHLLAQQTHQADQYISTLLTTDLQRSVLQTTNGAEQQTIAYSPFGHHTNEHTNTHLLGFNGERADPITGHYLLGNGYRAFNPVLMRFNSPDSWSPFGKSGINSYAYCMNNPVLRVDPTGHILQYIMQKGLDLAQSLRKAYINNILGGINLNSPGMDSYRLKIKPGISVTDAFNARDEVFKLNPYIYYQSAKSSLYLEDLSQTPFAPSLNLQEQAIATIKSNNLSTKNLPNPMQKLVTSTTSNRPYYNTAQRIKNGAYDPKTQSPDTNNLYIDDNQKDTDIYLNNLHARTRAISTEALDKYIAIEEAYFIRGEE